MPVDPKIILSDSFFKELIRNIPESLAVCDKDYNVILVNNAFLKLFESSQQDVIGKKFSNFITNVSNIDCSVCKNSPVTAIPDDASVHQATFTNSKGKEKLVRVSHSILDNTDFTITLFSPMTELMCLDQAQLDFVSTVSHELRTPMTSIKGFADTLLASGDKLTKEQQVRFINIIKSQADRLTRLVENLLTVSRLETKKHRSVFRSLNLSYYIERVIISLKSKYPEYNFRVKIADNIPTVWADQDKLEQILTNLIDNAAKYSSPGSTVIVKAYTVPDNDDLIQIDVIDQGIGIPEEHIPKIFNKFSRIDNPLTRQVQGTGLGLYITRALVESMKGSISVKSTSKGTVFSIKLLVATPERQAQQSLVEEY